MVNRLVLVLGDQLSTDLTALKQADRSTDLIVMAEVMGEGTYVPHHTKKIALILSAMRHFAEVLRADGWQVAYTRLDDEQNTHSLNAELLRRASETGATEIIVTQPGEWRLHNVLSELPIPVRMLPDDRFICGLPEFQNWAKGRKSLRMEYFYREMRRKTGLLMDGDQPLGDKWNFDHDNRKPAQDDLLRAAPMQFEPDAITQDVLKLVEQRFEAHFGTLRPFWFAVTREDALRALDHFVTHLLAGFGDYQDAMLQSDRFLHHSILSPYLNIGLLSPLEVCQRVEDAYHAGQVPLNAAEGYIRQVIGWREYVRGIYFMEGPDYAQRNALDHQRKVPDFYWGEPTRMNCVSHAVAQTRDEAYAHHIQRLMVTGNFALLAGVNPTALHEWYLAVYADAFEWVEAPNTVGMSQFADGGLLGSKPYVSSGNYINKMSDYCGSCSYSVTTKTGKKACPFNLLYWHFLMRHRARFERNPRMAQMYRTWDRMAEDKRATILRDAEVWLDDLDAGRPV